LKVTEPYHTLSTEADHRGEKKSTVTIDHIRTGVEPL
jgi:hypothetical protein